MTDSLAITAVKMKKNDCLLKNGCSLRLNVRDVRDCSYLFQVDEERLKRPVTTSPKISFRVAASNLGSAVA